VLHEQTTAGGGRAVSIHDRQAMDYARSTQGRADALQDDLLVH
jgi:hypothetical protein